jgi:hypothetical protein
MDDLEPSKYIEGKDYHIMWFEPQKRRRKPGECVKINVRKEITVQPGDTFKIGVNGKHQIEVEEVIIRKEARFIGFDNLTIKVKGYAQSITTN